MNEERENGRFDPADFIPADAQPKAAVSCELEEPPRGSALTGILGALFGALVGVVPWFLASTFADFFVGWLGFLVGVAACWGYRLFKGRRSTRFAMATVGFSAFALVFAVFGVFLIFHVRRRLVVEGGVFSYLPTFGRSRAFRLADIAGMTIGTNGRRLVGQDGRTLARFEDNQENSAILLQYLSEHGVGLLVK